MGLALACREYLQLGGALLGNRWEKFRAWLIARRSGVSYLTVCLALRGVEIPERDAQLIEQRTGLTVEQLRRKGKG